MIIAATGSGTLHSQLINGVVAVHGARRMGWRRELVKYISIFDGYGPGEPGEIRIPHVTPDAYCLDVTKDEEGVPHAAMIVWEVEVTNPVSAEKMCDYGMLWGELDATDIYSYIDFELRTIDKYGVERSCDLSAAYLSAVSRRRGIAGRETTQLARA